MAVNNLSRFSVGGLTTAQVDARVVAVTSGPQRRWLSPERDLRRYGAVTPTMTENASLPGVTLWGSQYYTFSASLDENCEYLFPSTPSWDKANVRARFYWMTTNTNTGNVIWRLIPLPSIADSSVLSDTVGTAPQVTDAGSGVTNRLQISPWSATTTLSGAADDRLGALIFQRQASSAPADTYTGTAILVGVELELTFTAPTDA